MEMWPNVTNLMKILVLYSLIGQCIASIFLTFGKKSVRAEHDYLKSSSVHRGIIFSFTAVQRNEICQDFFSTQLYMNPEAATSVDGRTPNIPIHIVHRWATQEEVQKRVDEQADIESESVFDEAGILLVCAQFFKSRSLPKVLNYISSTFRTKWFYAAQTYTGTGAPYSQYVTNFVVLSPDQVLFNQAELEKRYWNTRKIIETLREESRDYVELIERQDNLSSLSKNRKLNICACILSSPVYRQDRFEYSVNWINEINAKEVNLDYEEVQVSFDGLQEKLKTEGILCKAFENVEKPESQSTNIFLTRSYADGFSLIALKEKNDNTIVDKYFKNIAELITEREDMNSDKLFLNMR